MPGKSTPNAIPKALQSFHPLVSEWFRNNFDAPTDVQTQAWPPIQKGQHTLIAAPTGSGKTLAAFFSAINDLVQQSLTGDLPDQTQVVYISPLKALSNDIRRNLDFPLTGIAEIFEAAGKKAPKITARVRTGDTTPSQRTAMLKRPPHILVTTPESLYLLLTSKGGRKLLGNVRTLIVDEIHALVGNKRGSHLSLSMERLAALTKYPLQRIGLSATQKPIEQVARFLTGENGVSVGNGENGLGACNGVTSPTSKPEAAAPDPKGEPQTVAQSDSYRTPNGEAHALALHPNRDFAGSACVIINTGHQRKLDIGIELPGAPMTAVMANDTWEEIYEILEKRILEHTTTLIFVNTRRLAERLAHHLRQRLGKAAITAHHGSLSKDQRHDAEQRLKSGSLRALVATASMELGIDIGAVDLVCQISSPGSIAAFLQRVGRAGHYVGGIPKGRLFPLTRDDLVEGAAILDAVRRGELDRIIMPERPIDILAQQIVAEVACQEYTVDDLYQLMKRAYPFRNLKQEEFEEVVSMLADGFSLRRGRRGAYLHYDAVNGRLRARKGAGLAALTNGGAIPDNFNYDVILEPSGTHLGNVEEDFALESMAGDVFQLGNGTWKLLKIETGKVRVEDAHGQSPSIPFWFGETPGRTDELSHAVARLRTEIADRIDDPRKFVEEETDDITGKAEPYLEQWGSKALTWLTGDIGIPKSAADQIVLYLASVKMALGVMPSRETLVMERFFDEGGDMHLVIHSPYGSRLNRAWGLALRKRFCRNFNFELQAAAVEDAIILSLGATHSFPLEEVWDYLHPDSVRDVLIQALLDAPMFGVRWRWNASRSLAILRRRGGTRVAPALQRMDSEDLVSLVFPDQLACLENIAGEREVPEHPLVNQTIEDCLHEAMDIDGLEKLLQRLTSGEFTLIAKDLREASPLAQEIINAKPYAFLDPAGLDERRTHAIKNRRWLDPAEAADLGKLDPAAIEQVRMEAWPTVRDADELHEALVLLGFLTETEGIQGNGEESWEEYFALLNKEKRAARLIRMGKPVLWVAAERLPEFEAFWQGFQLEPSISFPEKLKRKDYEDHEARREIMRGRMEALGPVTQQDIADSIGISEAEAGFAMLALEAQGFVFQGQFTSQNRGLEWCERRLLARIHRYTLKTLRKEIQPVTSSEYMRFLFQWAGITGADDPQGPEALMEMLSQMEGYEAPAAAWESDIIPARMSEYDPLWLDMLCMSGRLSWGRLRLPANTGESRSRSGPIRSSPITLLSRENMDLWKTAAGVQETGEVILSPDASKIYKHLQERGASFFRDITQATRLLESHAENAMGELVSAGLVNSDSFTGLRALLTPSDMRPKPGSSGRGGGRRAIYGMDQAGRWALLERSSVEDDELKEEDLEEIARVLLRRYGVVFRRLADREQNVPPWRVMVRIFRRLEARGIIRGGRFIDGVWGEQYALPEAVGKLRKIRKEKPEGELLALSAVDPLCLYNEFTLAKKLPSLTNNRVLYRDGAAIALLEGKEVKFIVEVEPAEKWELQKVLIRKVMPRRLRAYLGKSAV